MFHTLFGATHFFSIKIVSQKPKNCKGCRPQTGHYQNSPRFDVSFSRNQSQMETDFDHRQGARTLSGGEGGAAGGARRGN